ncbi:PREDICTED: PRA1 family protein B5 [Camelina sativa]|uniref:PRA1 family protein n=1 Tax=Camelina sativa TaxID=90675 RepID=A0ABM0XSU5_CAMSA|nr:PREDICTED: PRA1 family protein B5 [Camelina sativa]
MVSTDPHVLPVSTTATATTTQPPIVTAVVESQPPAVRAFVNGVTETVRGSLSRSRPWSELLDRSAFTKPESLADAATRFRKNSSYFRVNYVCIVALILGFSLLAHPFSLVLLLCLAASWLFLYLFRPSDRPLVLFGRSFSEYETLGALILSTIAVIFFTSVGSVLISALMIGIATVGVHGAFRAPDDLFLDEQDPAAAGFLSFIGVPTTSSVAPSAAPSPV